MNINMHDQNSRDVVFIVLGFIMAIVSVLIFVFIFSFEILSMRFLFLGFVTVPFIVNGMAHLVHFCTDRFKSVDPNLFLALICLAITIISAVIGWISYINDHSFMGILRGLEAELIWFFVSLPSLVMTIIHFIISYIKIMKNKKAE